MEDISWARLHDNVPGRPSANGEPVGRQLAIMAREFKTVTIPEGGLHGPHVVTYTIWDSQCVRAVLRETGGLSVSLAVNRLGRCRATRPCIPTTS